MVRFKNRYIVVEITPKSNEGRPLVLKATALHNAIQQKVDKMYGDFGSASIKAGFNAKYCNTHTKIALIKCRHGPHSFLISAIPEINDVADRFVSLNILHVGATMKHCFAFIKKHQEKKLELMWKDLKNDKEREKVINAMMTMTPAMRDFK